MDMLDKTLQQEQPASSEASFRRNKTEGAREWKVLVRYCDSYCPSLKRIHFA